MAYKAKFWDGTQWVDMSSSITDTSAFVTQGEISDFATETYSRQIPMCLLSEASPSIPNNANTQINFNGEFDPLGWHVSGSGTISPNINGLYLINMQIFNTNNPPRCILRLIKSGSLESEQDVSATFVGGISHTDILSLNGSTDYVSMEVYQNSGSTMTPSSARFSATLLYQF